MLFTLSDKYEYLRFSRIDVTYIYLIMTFLLIDLKVFSYYFNLYYYGIQIFPRKHRHKLGPKYYTNRSNIILRFFIYK